MLAKTAKSGQNILSDGEYRYILIKLLFSFQMDIVYKKQNLKKFAI